MFLLFLGAKKKAQVLLFIVIKKKGCTGAWILNLFLIYIYFVLIIFILKWMAQERNATATTTTHENGWLRK